MAAKKTLGCLGIALVLTVVLALAAAAGLAWIIQSPRTIERVAGVPSGGAPAEGLKIVDWGSLASGRLRVRLPDALWQREVEALFPLTENIAGFVRLHLRRPRFVPDLNPRWLRLELDVEAEVLQGGSERFPGRAILRTRLKFDRPARTVRLDQAQLVEFDFTGEAGKLVGALKAALAEVVAAELKDYPVLEIPEAEGWMQQKGLSLLSDVVVEEGRVILVLGG